MSIQFNRQELGDRPDWILRILYAPVDGISKPIIGETRLMKACFLVHKKLEEETGTETDFEFRADDYGPLDPKVYDAVEVLKGEGLISTDPSEKYNGTKYDLTPSGTIEGKNLFEALPLEEQQLLSWIKGRHVLNSLSKLLSFVYNQYPEMAEKSKLR